jgi:iron complex outermembrane recepter protein
VSAADVQRNVRSWSCFVVICLAWALHSRAQQQTEAIAFDLRITAQPLDEALQEFSRQSGMQVIFFSSLTHGIQSPGVRGKYTVAEALKELLAGSGLSFRMINARTVEIRKASAPG